MKKETAIVCFYRDTFLYFTTRGICLLHDTCQSKTSSEHSFVDSVLLYIRYMISFRLFDIIMIEKKYSSFFSLRCVRFISRAFRPFGERWHCREDVY